ncbi:MAG: hypothetical protein KAT25_10905 [Sulfuriflexus sp.]|nr:hypothetical protein [Sulfuriflexus sp.]
MARKANRIDVNARQRIAQEAARLIAEHGIKDFQMAKQKAANSFGVTDKHVIPSNTEVEQALLEHQRLFHSESQPQRLKELRETAIKAMQILKSFEPRLVGSVQRGTASEYSDVNIHIFSDTSELFGHFLEQHKIPYEQNEKRLRISKDKYEYFPSYSFIAGDVPIDIVVFPVMSQRQAPLSSVDGKPMQRDDLKKVEASLLL